MVEFIYFMLGVLFGGTISNFFHRRSGRDLRREAQDLAQIARANPLRIDEPAIEARSEKR
jgi:hypothetical protein